MKRETTLRAEGCAASRWRFMVRHLGGRATSARVEVEETQNVDCDRVVCLVCDALHIERARLAE